jgi:hypothetical protein
MALQLFRLRLIPLFLVALYKIIDLLSASSQRGKKICVIFSLIISGLGVFAWPLVALENWQPEMRNVPLDLWAYEANNFMVLRYYPHVLLSVALIILVFYFFYQALEKNSYRLACGTGILALILFSFHPFQVPLIYAVPLVYLVVLSIKNKKIEFSGLKKYLLLVLISLPSVIYYLYTLAINENLQLKAMQNDNLMPNLFVLVFSLGLGLFFALYYIYYIFKNKKFTQANIFLLVWFFTTLFIVYLPFNFQRRMLAGFMVPLAILAYSALELIYGKIKDLNRLAKIFLIVSLVFLLSFTNLFTYIQDFRFLRAAFDNKAEHNNLVYVDGDVKNALAWYKKTALANDIILSSNSNGNLIPGLTGQKVFLGHPVETVGWPEKMQDVKSFFSGYYSQTEEIDFLQASKITYIFYTDLEKQLGSFDPALKPYLQEVFTNAQVNIYKVVLNQ